MSVNRREVVTEALKEYAERNNIKAIEALIKLGIDIDYYLDQMCEIAKPGSTGREFNIVAEELKQEENIDEQVRACIKVLSLDEEKDTNVIKAEDINYLRSKAWHKTGEK